MCDQNSIPQNAWDEQASQAFIDYGHYFVPEREHQYQIIVDLLPTMNETFSVIDLCCGEGLLSQLILEQRARCVVYGLDGSKEMRKRARGRLADYGDRFRGLKFDLHARSWPEIQKPIRVLVSSLAIHHLDGPEKKVLFGEVFQLLETSGVFVVSDIMEPTHSTGWALAAKEWDDAVRERALQLDGSLEGLALFEQMRWNMYRYFDPQDIDKPSPLLDQLTWLVEVGFSKVDVFWVRAGHAIFGAWKL